MSLFVAVEAHSVAVTLRSSAHVAYRYTGSSGVVVGTCTGCRAPLARQGPSAFEPCVSMRHQSGRASRARYIPGPAALPFLWGPEEVSAQLATPRTKRREVRAGCRSSAQKQSRMQPLACFTSSPSGGGSSAPAGTAPDRSGLEILSCAAAAQEPMSAPSPPLPRPPLASKRRNWCLLDPTTGRWPEPFALFRAFR